MTRRLCSGFSCSVVFSPWMRIPSASRGICRATPALLRERGYQASPKTARGRAHLQGDEVFQNLDALQVLRVLLDVGVREERLRRTRAAQKLSETSLMPDGEGVPQTFS